MSTPALSFTKKSKLWNVLYKLHRNGCENTRKQTTFESSCSLIFFNSRTRSDYLFDKRVDWRLCGRPHFFVKYEYLLARSLPRNRQLSPNAEA